jgi:type VI protein secretion system component VasK
MEGGERMIETYAEATEDMIKANKMREEEMQKKLIDMITKNEKLKEKNEYLQKEVEDAKAVEKRALCEVQELIEKNKRLVEEHNRQNGTIQALNIALDVITDRYSNLRKRLCRTGKGGE